ncbi:MAG: CbiX/SirB N-terminal domain-containing protein, partial [Halobacteriales archaeon]|nr:CbiX/SirB N-terminal domain-containing protein [Halobacteriales archaeon]
MTTQQALLLTGHGSHHDALSAAPVYEHADRVRERGCFDAVRTAFWKEQPSLAEVRSTVEAASVYIVPLLTSEGYFAERVFPRELGLAGDKLEGERDVYYTEPVGTHERLADVIVNRVNTVTNEAANQADIGLVLVGHGTDRHERSADATVAHADRLRNRGTFASVESAFLDQTPNVDGVTERVDTTDIVVVPLFVSNGHHVTRDIPAALGLPAVGDPFGGPTPVGEKRLWYAGAVGTAPSLTDVVIERAAEAGAETQPGRTSEAGPSEAEVAFLSWLEGGSQDGVDGSERTREWGELAITVTEDCDDRRFDVRHESDRSAPVGDLDQLSTSAEVRDKTGRDNAGNHRPLRT